MALTEGQRTSIESVSMDMSRAYRKATFAHVEKPIARLPSTTFTSPRR
ncbi:hypothetical protein [Billgrantia desiderata]